MLTYTQTTKEKPIKEQEENFKGNVVVLVTQTCPTLCDPAKLLCPWISPGKNTGAGCHFILQGIFMTQGLNPGLPR